MVAQIYDSESNSNSLSGIGIPNNGFVFITTAINLDIIIPYQIAPKHFLDKATPPQIEQIKVMLNVFNPNPFYNFYEFDINDKGELIKMEPQNWRYFVVNYEGQLSESLQEASLVIPCDLRYGFSFQGPSCRYHSQSIHTFYSDHVFHDYGIKVQNITLDDILLISNTNKRLNALSPKFVHIKRSFRRFKELCNLPRSSELTIIGLFSIIEALTTHSATDNYDSITHQVSTKMPLLGKYFIRKVNMEKYFDDIEEDRLWKLLYKYRSKIAHGDDEEFNRELKVLRERRNITKFLLEITKLLLILSVRKPELITDLKRC